MSGNPEAAEVELHRPYIDEVTFTCPDCGKTMKRVPEVIDCWFDSGAMPFAQHHYPFENKDLFEQQFPAQVHFRGCGPDPWMVLFPDGGDLHCCLTRLRYENVIVLGHVQDENGQKMSKSKGNAVDPFDALTDLRCRRDPLVFLHQQCTVAAEPFPRQGRVWKDSASSWVLSGIPTHSSFCMRILTILMQQNIRWTMISFR